MRGLQTWFLSAVRLTLFSTLVLALVPALQARRGDDDRDEVTRTVTLAPTASAPETARGVAKLEIGHRSDPTFKRIELDTFGLPAGVYTVTVFDVTGASAELGTLTTGDGGDDDDKSKRRGGDDNDEGEADFDVPDSVNALTLTTIAVTDALGAEVLVGDFSDITTVRSGRLFSRAPLIETAAAPDTTGSVEVRGHQRRGKSNGQFRLEARGLPANTPVVLNMDGTDVLTATTDRRGRLRIRKSARDLNIFAISTISLRDETGTELAHAQF